MFGKPCPRPLDPDVVVLPWVWTCLYKIDPVTLQDVEKSRGTCNGGTRHGKVVTLAVTYAACVKQPAHRLTWALIAALNYVGLGCDVSNAFAEAPPPKEPLCMVQTLSSATGGKTALAIHLYNVATSYPHFATYKDTPKPSGSGTSTSTASSSLRWDSNTLRTNHVSISSTMESVAS
jgi:hypothetical protein